MTDENRPGTSGEGAGTSGIAPATLGWLVLVLFLTVNVMANATSTIAEHGDRGFHRWEAWSWEISSAIVWCGLAPLIWRAVSWARQRRLSWPLVAIGVAAITAPVSAIHVAGMVALRKLIYWAAGHTYVFANDIWGALLYEYRKDVATTVGFVLVFALIQWLVPRRAASTRPDERPMLAVRDGAVLHQVPIDEIDHVTSAANYVEIRWRGWTLLHRATLAGVEAALAGHGFVRIHRTRLVRRGAIRRIAGNQSGDYEVVLESGEALKGSRRYPLAI
ncbi:LytTR family DNA-binding domain-containing protein [Sphingosinicella sp. LHD-64]|uniref:LytR/AlgR family response regulator transcription factor n=1 Tax=Sphingosinicella sp. LHD-64 TaxID=3072139 RepID=UPI00280C81BD|nr:LytTR family DNA-binding domain-containing protein [Sphingosinicella sp. LHD-64]MDQ8758033.1 LytTR family DNA-binding domain-containing protein [Sphingosinicella sp. LHD-64]